jgi:DHA1 family tetracycline resistance protein-like MFS transporter
MKRSPLVVIFVTVFIDLVGFGIVIPVLPFYVEGTKFNASPRVVGLLFASYSIMQLIFTPILGRWSDKYGRRPILFFSLLGTSLGFFILGFATTLWMLFAGRIIDGITGGNISTAQAYIADVTTKEDRAKGMGLIGAAFGLGFIFGPAIGGILSRWGTHVPFLFAGALALANATLLYFVLPETVTPDHPARVSAATGRWSQLLGALSQTRLAFVLAIYFLFITAFSIMTSTFGLFTLYRFGFDAHDTGWIFAFVGVVGACIQGGLIGRLVKMFGEPPLHPLDGAAHGDARASRLRRALRGGQRIGDALAQLAGVEERGRGRTGRRSRRNAVGREPRARRRPAHLRRLHLQRRGDRRLRQQAAQHERPLRRRHLLGRRRHHVPRLHPRHLLRTRPRRRVQRRTRHGILKE